MKFYFAAVFSVAAVVAVFIDAECNCNTTEACGLFPTAPCSQPGDPDRCDEGWFGSYCQKQNVALRRPSNQTSTFMENATWTNYQDHYFTADHAVDGRATTLHNEIPLTCSHTDIGDQPLTWTVYLNTSSTDRIQNMRLYLREKKQYRNVGMEIFVGSQMCYNWSSTEHPPPIANVTCRQPLTGNNVTIWLPGGWDIYLSLCEVQIFVCSNGWFGTDCDKQCRCPILTELCDKITGTCIVCSDGYYDMNCASKCGHCLNGVACDKTTGICLRGCASGWTTNTCQSSCPDGYYGINCASQCGHCLNGVACANSTGICPSGCASGWTTDTCQSSCGDGRYGHHCQSECGQCKGDLPCNKITGTCDQGCRPGFQGPFCKECIDGMYGDDCMSRCGQCKDASTCDKSSGECLEGCQGNFMKPLCKAFPATSGRSNWEVPVAATLGSLFVLAAIALLTSIIYIRRLKKQLNILRQKPEDDFMSLDGKTRDPVAESPYANLDNTVL